MTEKILLVDDEPNILSTFKRMLRDQFRIEVADGGECGLEAIDNLGPFAVVVADMRMPGMDGIQFLSKVKERSPDSIRMMLTGNTDLQTAMDAVNEGNIFRFLTKPILSKTFTKALRAGIDQYILVTAEKELLEKTLSGSVKVLTEVLSLVNPAAFSRTSRISRIVTHIARYMKLTDLWQFQIAAMLSQIGCMALPQEILDKIYYRKQLTFDEEKLFASHPSVASKLLAKIPRLEPIAHMIAGQQQVYKVDAQRAESTQEYIIALGSQILKVALDYDQLVINGMSHQFALSTMQKRHGIYNPQVLTALENLRMEKIDRREVLKKVRMSELKVGMIFDENIKAKNGLLLAPKGQEVTYTVLMRLRNLSSGIGIVEPFRVRVVANKD